MNTEAARPAVRRRPATDPSPRHRARELVLQGLYQWQVSGNTEAAIEAHLRDSEEFQHADHAFFTSLLRGVIAEREALAEQLADCLDRSFAELSPIESCVLLAGAYELKNCCRTPYRVVINESIELAKAYGGTDGHKYVNGVLDRLAAQLRRAEVEADRQPR